MVRGPHDVRGDVRRTGTVDDRYRRLNPMSLRGHLQSLKLQESLVANDRFRLGLFDACPRDATTLRTAPV